MGILSSKTRIKVQSNIYNLAGDIADRPNFLKTVMFDQTMYKPFDSYSTALSSSYLNGQGIKLRRVVPYVKRSNYSDLTGQNKARITTADSIDVNELTDLLSFRLQESVSIIEASIEAPLIYFWTEQWLLENHPSMVDSEYDADFVEDTDEVKITFTNTGHVFTFTPDNFDQDGEYLYVLYRPDVGEEGVPLVVYGETEEVEELPDMSAWNHVSTNIVDSVFSWVKRTNVSIEYTDGRFKQEPEVVEEFETVLETTHSHYNSEMNIPSGKILYDSYHSTTYKLVPTKEEVIEETDEYVKTIEIESFDLIPIFEVNTDTTNTTIAGKGAMKVLLYKNGGGDGELDKFFTQSNEGGDYFPFIPVKTDLRPGRKARQIFIDSESMPDMYEANVKIMRKVSDKNTYDDILNNLKDNEGSDSINYAYIMFGASINTPDTSAMVYIYKYFRALMGTGTGDPAYISYEIAWNRAEESVKKWNEWYLAQSDPESPLFGSIEPGILAYPSAPTTTVSITSNNKFSLNYRMSWNGLRLTKGKGRAVEGLKTHYSHIKKGSPSTMTGTGLLGKFFNKLTNNPAGDEIIVYYQIDDDNWEAVHIYGLNTFNLIYRGKGVSKKAYDELDEKDESSLLIPLNDAVFRSMPLIAATQMTTGCMYLVVNTYQTWKKKWYESDLFKVILIVAIVVMSIFSGGAAAPLAGTIGALAAGAVGLVGVAALVFALAVNAIAGLIISRILTAAATALFGDKIGMIVGAIATVVAMNAMNAFAAGTQFNVMDAFSGGNLLKLSSTIATDFGKMYAEETANIISESEKMFQEFKEQSDILQDAYNTEFGDRALLDPLKFLEVPNQLYFEKSEAFLQRTLMTGSEISELSMDAISMLTDIGTQINLQ